MFASCKTCTAPCCEYVDFGYVALFHFLGIDWIQYPPPYHIFLMFYPGLQPKIHTIEEFMQWLRFFGFEERDDGEEYFRCRYHDEITAKCPYYHNRPLLCRGYDCYDEESHRFFSKYKRRNWK